MNKIPGKSWRQSPVAYYIAAIWRSIILPPFVRRWQKNLCIRNWEERPDAEIIRNRVNYYNNLHCSIEASANAKPIRNVRLKDTHSRYWFDLMRYFRGIDSEKKVDFINGDTWENPDSPVICKARRLDEKATHCVLFNMDSLRHFTNVSDYIPFEDKDNILFFRGDIHGKPHRIKFFKLWASHPDFNIGDTSRNWHSPWPAEKVPITEHFRHKYILALEGNDVATAVQWIFASNCVPVMTRPTVESWLMHGAMIPGLHYIEISPDFSDVAEKIAYYNAHPDEARSISEASKEWISQFADPQRESIISHLVADRYCKYVK